MIITVEDLKKQISCGDVADDVIAAKLEAIEAVIRAYTNNNFQQRGIRFAGHSDGFMIFGDPLHFGVGDTVQISGSDVNDGLYVITAVGNDYIEVDQQLLTTEFNLVTKIRYPADVVQCAVDLFKWKQTMGDKVGIQSETLSRHSVTYFNMDGGNTSNSANSLMGYPASLLGCLKPYRKARC